MVKPAVTDVVSPAVTAEGPNALLDQRVGNVRKVARFERRQSRQLGLEGFNALTLLANAGFGGLIGVEQGLHKFVAQARREPLDQFPRELRLLVDRQAHAQREFRVVFKQRVRPGGAAAIVVDGVRRGGQVAAVNRRAARGVANQRAIAEQLRHQLDVGGFAATRAGAGEFEQGLQQLDVFHLAQAESAAVGFRNLQEEVPVVALGFAQRHLGRHVDGLVLGLALGLGRADFHAQRAAGAILRRHLQRVLHLLEFLPARRGRLEGGRSFFQQRRVVNLGPDHRVRANQHALAALDAEVLIPDREFPARCCAFPTARWRWGRFRPLGMALTGSESPSPSMILASTSRTNAGACAGTAGRMSKVLLTSRRNLDLVQMIERSVHGGEVLLHHGFAAPAVGLLDGVLDGGDGFLARQHSADGEEAGLHDGVDAAAHAGCRGPP